MPARELHAAGRDLEGLSGILRTRVTGSSRRLLCARKYRSSSQGEVKDDAAGRKAQHIDAAYAERRAGDEGLGQNMNASCIAFGCRRAQCIPYANLAEHALAAQQADDANQCRGCQ